MRVKKKVVLVAMLAMALGIGGSAAAQISTPRYALGPDGDTLIVEGFEQGLCSDIFAIEQQDLAVYDYPTPLSNDARACEFLGVVNPYPAPFFQRDGIVFTYYPLDVHYYGYAPSDGVNPDFYSILDPISGAYYIYNWESNLYEFVGYRDSF